MNIKLSDYPLRPLSPVEGRYLNKFLFAETQLTVYQRWKHFDSIVADEAKLPKSIALAYDLLMSKLGSREWLTPELILFPASISESVEFLTLWLYDCAFRALVNLEGGLATAQYELGDYMLNFGLDLDSDHWPSEECKLPTESAIIAAWASQRVDILTHPSGNMLAMDTAWSVFDTGRRNTVAAAAKKAQSN